MAKENDLEYLVSWHPYLIDPRFRGVQPVRQLRKDGQRLDLLFRLKSRLCSIVELKKTSLQIKDIVQLETYCANWSEKERLGASHYLVGGRPKNSDRLIRRASASPYGIHLLFFGPDFPLSLMWDDKAQEYIPYDDSQPTKHAIRLRF